MYYIYTYFGIASAFSVNAKHTSSHTLSICQHIHTIAFIYIHTCTFRFLTKQKRGVMHIVWLRDILRWNDFKYVFTLNIAYSIDGNEFITYTKINALLWTQEIRIARGFFWFTLKTNLPKMNENSDDREIAAKQTKQTG